MTKMKIRNNEMMEAKIKVKNIDSHFSELRKRIIFSLIVYLIATILGFVFHRNILKLNGSACDRNQSTITRPPSLYEYN